MKDARDAPEARDAWRFLIKWGLFWLLMLYIPFAIFGIVATDDAGQTLMQLIFVWPIFLILVLKIPARKAEDFIGGDDGEAP
ncbi:hypothetical protein [Candidatus Palauibacter sp.]|uniref:hypothetical protein n=1 Tax=Candidatus Palauibacter sp. TaxID=3101350 RepID=UPI003B5C8CBF